MKAPDVIAAFEWDFWGGEEGMKIGLSVLTEEEYNEMEERNPVFVFQSTFEDILAKHINAEEVESFVCDENALHVRLHSKDGLYTYLVFEYLE